MDIKTEMNELEQIGGREKPPLAGEPGDGGVKRALSLAVLQQLLTFPLAALILDGGGMLLCWVFAVAAFWGAAGLMLRRRARVLTALDVFLLRWGFFIVLVISFVVARWIWGLRGAL